MDEVKKGMRRRLTRYGDDAFALFLRKSFIKGLGYGDAALDKPVIGIINTASDFNSCHGNVDELVQSAKDGVLAAGANTVLAIRDTGGMAHCSFLYHASRFATYGGGKGR
jgi:dihydroxyacid dehydratase/phosphogluconate dehydratase